MKILVLTGAGISAESGIPTFRGDDGIWEGHPIEDVATPDGFRRNPSLVQQFYNGRRRKLLDPDVQPNAAHVSLAEFERQHDDEFLLVTQNIDNLLTGDIIDWTEDLSADTVRPDEPDLIGTLRPHVVWFGEMPLGLETIAAFAERADVFIAIGTSAVVYPAAGIVQTTRASCRRIEINLDATPQSEHFHQTIRGKASVEVPKVLESLK